MTDASYFDDLYAERDDPWDLSASEYERRKLDLLLASLSRSHYRFGFEPGCAIGVTTRALAERCDRLIAMDGARAAVQQARAHMRDADQVSVVHGRVPADWPAESFDLIVLSELLYYLDDGSRLEVADRVIHTLAPGGELVAVHWRHPFEEAPVTGDQVHAELAARLGAGGLVIITRHVEDDCLLEVYRLA